MKGTVTDWWHVTDPETGKKKRGPNYGKGSQWKIRWELPASPDGKRRYRAEHKFKTRAEAEARLREVLGEQDKGRPVERSKETVSDAIENWLKAKSAARKSSTTLDLWTTVLETHVKPRLGAARTSTVTVEQVERLYQDLSLHGKAAGPCRTAGITCQDHQCEPKNHEGLGQSAMRHVSRLLGAVLRYSLGESVMLPTDAQRAREALPKSGPAKVGKDEYPTDEQARKFIEATAGDMWGHLWAVALSTGLRRGELAGLRWSDLTLTGGPPTLHVSQTITVVRGHASVRSGGKTDAASREVPLSAFAVGVLRERWKQQRAEQLAATNWQGGGDFVFPSPTGEFLNPQLITRRFTAAAVKHGLPPVGLHGCRHYFITTLLRRGVPVKTVAKIVGHKNASLTFDVYTHAIPGDEKLAAQAMDATLLAAS